MASRLDSGSSIRNTCGSRTTARASAARCRWPPESAPGLRSRSWPSSTISAARRISASCLLLRHAAHPQGEADVLVDAHVRVERVALEHHGDVAVAGVDAADRLAADDDLAGGRLLEPGDHPHRRGLAAARGAEQHQELLVGDRRFMSRTPMKLPKDFSTFSRWIDAMRYPLTAPMVSPRDRCFWIRITSTKTGRKARKETRAIAL